MSELEPTRTYSNLTTIERFRAMLDERGVEWDYGITGATTTRFRINGVDLTFMPMRDGLVCTTILTPEQAIAATVGSDKVEAVLRKLIARLGVAADFHFARKYVDCIVEEYAGKLATLGAGTCHDKNGFDPELGFECTVCGAMTDGYMLSPEDTGHYKQFNFCPMCGRRIEQ